MLKPRVFSTSPSKSVIFAGACLLLTAGARAQEREQPPPPAFAEEVAAGVELYGRGEYESALKAFKKAAGKRKDDPDAWHFLGLTYGRLGKSKDSRKALEKAVALGFAKLVPKPIPGGDYQKLSAEERAARALTLASNLRRAAAVVEDYLRLGPPDSAFWRAQLESLRFHAAHTGRAAERANIFSSADVERRAQITSRPEPLYTEEARSRGVSGRITLRLLLAADGTVDHILVLEALPHGLTEKAIAAARAIQFVPAMREGRSVSQFVTIQFNFNVR